MGVRWFHLGLLAAMPLFAQTPEADPVFRSDVTVGRIDAQVLNGHNLPVGHLYEDSFLLRYNGKPVKITEFSYEQMPADVLLLLDVSGSMQPQIDRLSTAAQRALAMLGPNDQVGIMTFNSGTRVELKLGRNRDAVSRTLEDIVRNNSFMGGTDINRALLDAAKYIGREGRRDARHAIVIVTDDVAEPCDRVRVGAALSEADAVLMALITPRVDMRQGGPVGRPGQLPPPIGFPPIIIGPGRSTQLGNISAGTPAIAEDSGGESRPVSNSYALEEIFARIRQWYAIYFALPDAAQDGRTIEIEMDIADAVRWQHPDAELRYRQTYLTGQVRKSFAKRIRAHAPTTPRPRTISSSEETPGTVTRRRRAVSEGEGSRVQITPLETKPEKTTTPEPEPTAVAEPVESKAPAPRRRAVEERSGSRPVN